jgi:hypothetical protein
MLKTGHSASCIFKFLSGVVVTPCLSYLCSKINLCYDQILIANEMVVPESSMSGCCSFPLLGTYLLLTNMVNILYVSTSSITARGY